MALSLGDITFGLGANTAGLQKAVDALNQFGRSLNQTARAQQDAATAGVNAMARQEHAIRQALQQVMNLNAQIKRADGPINLMSNNVRAFQRFTKEMTSGTLSTTEFLRTQDWLTAKLNMSRRAFADFRAQQLAAGVATSKLSSMMRDLQSASVLAVGPLSGVGARISALTQLSGRTTVAIAGMVAGITGASVAVFKLGSAALEAGKALDVINTRLSAATGSSGMAAAEFDFVSEQSRKLGLDLRAAATEYGRLAAATAQTSLAGSQTREIFLGVAEAATAMRLAPQQFERAMLAITQMVGKGRVSSEELRQQFGEHIPGALRLAADAMGVTTMKLFDMMEKGELMAEEFLPLLAQKLRETFGPGAVKGADSLIATQNRLATAQLLFNKTLDETLGVSTTYKAALKSVTEAIDFLRENLNGTIAVIGGVAGAMLGLASPMIITGIISLANAIKTAAGAMLALNIAAMANPVGAIIGLLGRLGLAAAGAAGGYYLLKDALDSSITVQDDFTDSVDRYIEKARKMGGVHKGETDIFVEEINKRIKATERQLQAQLTALDEARRAEEQARNNFAQKTPQTINSTRGSVEIAPDRTELDEASAAVGILETKVYELSQTAQTLRQQLEALKGLPILGKGETQVSKEFEKTAEKVRDMVRELNGYTDAWVAAQTQGEEAAQQMMDLAKAQEMLKKVPEAEMVAINKLLKEHGFEANSAAEALAMLITAHRSAEGSVKDLLESLDKVPEALKEAKTEILDLHLKAEALRRGPDALKQFETAQKHRDSLEKMRESLDKAGVSQAEINRLMGEYKFALEDVDEAQKTFDKFDKILDKVEKGFDRAFDRIGEAITESFLKGEEAAIDWGNLVTSVVSEVMQTVIDIMILDPVKEATRSGLSSIMQNGLGSFFEGLFGGQSASVLAGGYSTAVNSQIAALPFAHGGAFSMGKVIPFANGGITNGPSFFPMSNGRTGVMGEAGEEAVFPLTRIGGDLGVRAIVPGGGGDVIINVYNNTGEGTEVTEERRQTPRGMEIDIVLDKTMAKRIRAGGDSAQAIAQVFGLRGQMVGR